MQAALLITISPALQRLDVGVDGLGGGAAGTHGEDARDTDGENDEEAEALLKQLVETNYFAGIPLLADFYYTNCRFSDVIDTLDPYLKKIDDIDLYLFYAESCVFAGELDKLKTVSAPRAFSY